MKITSLNCGTFSPPNLSRLLGSSGSALSRIQPAEESRFAESFKELVTHVLLIELEKHLILIDTGVGKKQMQDLRRTLKGRLQGVLMGLRSEPEMTAAEQLKKAGYSPSDVTDVILTHLDTDHVGGLVDFPQARAHLFRTELESANAPRTRFEKLRFLRGLWQNHEHFELYDGAEGKGETFHGLELIPLRGIPEELMLLALPGHTAGHAGVYLRGRNFLFAGDACVNRVVLTDDYQPAAVRLYQYMTTTHAAAWNRSLSALKHLCSCGVTVCCAHDREQFEQYSRAFKSL
jgi:glyoxylase-like metal-dependent hydrolase (beta-lactamase superfamily II)